MESKATGAPQRVRVQLGERSYDILIGCGLLSRAGDYLLPLKLGSRGVVITDTNVESRYAGALGDALHKRGITVQVLTVPAGEASKSLRQANRLFEKLPSLGLDRQSFVIALGGGVVGDLAGFVAASYLRGIALVQMPTSLLAQVDSSVGGKTGINMRHGKNLLGAFHQPRMVLADTATLATLPVRELRAGYAETVKAGLIGDAAFFQWCEANGAAVVGGDRALQAEAILRACAFKAQVVGDDEREEKPNDGRALLNLGHTFGHAIEAAEGYGGWLHGEAVAAGIVLAAETSARLGWLDAAALARVRALIERAGLPVRGPRIGVERALSLMALDKKVEAGRIRLVLLRALGEGVVSGDYDPAALRAVLAAGLA